MFISHETQQLLTAMIDFLARPGHCITFAVDTEGSDFFVQFPGVRRGPVAIGTHSGGTLYVRFRGHEYDQEGPTGGVTLYDARFTDTERALVDAMLPQVKTAAVEFCKLERIAITSEQVAAETGKLSKIHALRREAKAAGIEANLITYKDLIESI